MLVYLNELGMTTAQIGWITGSGWIIGAFAGPIIGYLSDQFGHRRIYIMIMIIWTVSFFLFWIANGFLFFLIVGLINGFGRSCIDPILLTRMFAQVTEESLIK
jgi:MFS family permease